MLLRWFVPLAMIVLAGCRRSSPAPANVAPVDAAAPVGSAAPPDAGSQEPDAAAADAGTAPLTFERLTPEQRLAYTKAIAEGRRARLAKQRGETLAAYDRALDVLPGDAQALAERGYTRFVLPAATKRTKEDLDPAKADLERALRATTDPKLAAQVHFNLGLVAEALAALGDGEGELRTVALGHFRRSNELAPTKAAAARDRMDGCPMTVSTPDVKIHASMSAVQAALSDAGAVPDVIWPSTGTIVEALAMVVLPLDDGRFVTVEVGPMAPSECGPAGAAIVARVEGTWHVVYQAQHVGRSPGPDGLVCLHGGEDEGAHEELWIDAKTGQGLADVGFDHAFLGTLPWRVDASKRRLEAHGLGCDLDLALPPRAEPVLPSPLP